MPPNLEMLGPYAFNPEEIDRIVTKPSPGNYALGYTVASGTFIVQYVGRSDSDLNEELKARVTRMYQEFKYSHAFAPKYAFEKECRNYHEFGRNRKLLNESHPSRPDGADWRCPKCRVFGNPRG